MPVISRVEAGKAVCSSVLLSVVLLICALTGRLTAQTQNGTILGTISDPSGAFLPGTKITATNHLDGSERSVTADSDGSYHFLLLPSGDYTITVEHSGFKLYQDRGLHLETNQTLRVDVALKVGAKTEQVTVEGEAAAIDTDTPGISNTQLEKQVKDNPELVYNPTHIYATHNIAYTERRLGFYGGSWLNTTTSLNGVEVDYFDLYPLGYAVDEMKSDLLLAPAKYERSATVNMTLKHGENQLHGFVQGTLYQNLFFALSDPRAHVDNCTSARPCTGSWTAGGEVSGPVYIPKLYDGRNRTFWMFTYTPQKNFKTTSPITYTVPGDAFRAGNFSGLSSPITNPFTGLPFSGNQIPSNMISTVSSNLMSGFFPSAVGTTTTPATANDNTPQNVWWTMGGRLDQKISSTNQFNVAYSKFYQRYEDADGRYSSYRGVRNYTDNSWVWSFADTHVFSPTIINEARFGINYVAVPDLGQGESAGTRMQDIGLTGIPTPRIDNLTVTGPRINISGITSLRGQASNSSSSYFYQLSDSLSIHHKKHIIEAGVDLKWSNNDYTQAPTDMFPTYGFDGRFTGSGFADFLLGLPGSISRTNARPTTNFLRRTLAFYVQDQWQITPRLTLSLGNRFEFIAPLYSNNSMYYNFDPKTGNLVVPSANSLSLIDPAWPLATNPIVTAKDAGFPEHLVNGTARPLTPRIGFAFRPFRNDRTVVRGGWGLYNVADLATGGVLAEYGNPSYLGVGGPFALSTAFSNAMVEGTPLLQWPFAFPPEGGTLTNLPTVTGVNPKFVYPYTQQWNLTVEHEIHGQGLRLSYIGNKDTKLGYTRDINIPRASTVPFTTDRYVYPNYVSIPYVDNGATAVYHGFESALTLKKIAGITGEIGYSWAGQWTDSQNNQFLPTVGGSTIENPYCLKCERARYDSVPMHRMYARFLWDLPFGVGQKFGGGASHVKDELVGHWTVSTEFRARTGLGMTPLFDGSDPSNTNTFGGRPDCVGNPVPTSWRTIDNLINLAAYAVPPDNAGRYGNCGRNTVLGPGGFYMNFGVFKAFPVRERMNVVFSATSTNVLNHPVWDICLNGPINSPNGNQLCGTEGNYFTAGNPRGSGRQIYFNLSFGF
ncbi:MAG: carboxypeptidase regulatory-like domain-containing protein [Acidobacteriia bacterium]|nr:carboxypeptidase regulatory-like domain-containing protein [Terriglobia bacterium]